MQDRQAVGLVYGPEEHHLDHLASVCSVMRIPLVVTEEELEKLAKKYYPHVEVVYHNYATLSQAIVQQYDIVFTALPKILIEEIFFFAQRMLHKRLHSIWCPHGNSDKGHTVPFIEGLNREEIALVYGQKMLHFLRLKEAFDQLKAYVMTGNFRYFEYQKKKEFYQNILEKEVKGFHHHPVILYAPTWEDSEKSSSFFSAAPILIDKLPETYFLIIKLHPHLIEHPQTERMILKYENHPRVQFLTHFPPVYPLLDLCDIYLGDMSSVGYDFLTFNKPMFFFNETSRNIKNDPGLYLYRCGVEVPLNRYCDIYQLIHYHLPSDREDFFKIRQEVYAYTFGQEKNEEILRQEILNTYHTLPDLELDFL